MKNKNLILGFLWPNIIAALIIGTLGILQIVILKTDTKLGPEYGISTFIILPLIMGSVSALFWSKNKTKFIYILGRLSINVLTSFFMAAIFMGEGVLCLLILLPLVLVLMILGYLVTKFLIRKNSNSLNFSVSGLLLAIVIMDISAAHHYENEVSDTMLVHAPPSVVWKYVVSTPVITEKSHYWFFNIGLPKPIGTTVTGYCKGGGRKCVFEKNLVFDEVMSVYEPGVNLTFDVVKQPQDPEIMGHIVIERGQYLLHDNHDGTTTLTGNSWYSLKVYPALYFDIWARSITRNVHVRVMEHIKNLCEQN